MATTKKDHGKTENEEKDIGKKELRVKAGTSDKEIIESDANGEEVFFDFEDFRMLDGEVLDELSRTTLDRYFVELGLYRRKAVGEKDGKRLNIQVLGGSPEGRLRTEGLPEGMHGYWARPEEVYERKRQGYVTVDGRFPEVKAGDKSAGGARKITSSDGKTDELVLMACPEGDYQARLQEMSDKSRGRPNEHAAEFDNESKKIDGGTGLINKRTVEKVTMKG